MTSGRDASPAIYCEPGFRVLYVCGWYGQFFFCGHLACSGLKLALTTYWKVCSVTSLQTLLGLKHPIRRIEDRKREQEKETKVNLYIYFFVGVEGQ